ncbi:MAG: sulfate adenylyltransferase [Chloroflexota bacterium]
MIQTAELLSVTGLSQKATSPLPTKENQLVNRLLKGSTRLAVKERTQKMLHLDLSPLDVAKLLLITHGALSPLTGFMNHEDYESVLFDMRLSDGSVWGLPITLTVDEETAVSIKVGQEVALCENGRVLAVIEVADKFNIDKLQEAALLYQTTDESHSGVQQVNAQSNIAIGGDIWAIDMPSVTHDFYSIQFTPAQTRRMFARRGWRNIVGYHPSSPIFRTDEYIQKTALELVDGLFILHPINPPTADNFSSKTSLLTYQKILGNYYPSQNVLLGVYSGFLHNGGPRSLLLCAQIHKNYGCTHFIVSEAKMKKNKLVFENFTNEELGIIIMQFDTTYFCAKCDMIVSQKTCPHGDKAAIYYSNTDVKHLIDTEKEPESVFIRPEVSALLRQA